MLTLKKMIQSHVYYGIFNVKFNMLMKNNNLACGLDRNWVWEMGETSF